MPEPCVPDPKVADPKVPVPQEPKVKVNKNELKLKMLDSGIPGPITDTNLLFGAELPSSSVGMN